MADYANPDVLVSTDWVLEHAQDPDVRVIEVNEDVLLYDTGHAPGSVKIDWLNDLWDDTIREFIQPDELATLFESLGVSNDTTVVVYGDKNNWWAAYAFWFFRYNGHENLKLMNGGRAKTRGRVYVQRGRGGRPQAIRLGVRSNSFACVGVREWARDSGGKWVGIDD